jgi:hypothetical protein
MIYTYPRPQIIFNNTLFLIKETVDSNKFDEYQIPYRVGNGIKIRRLSHAFLQQAIDRGDVKLLEKKGSFNDKPYYRVPLEIQLKLF